MVTNIDHLILRCSIVLNVLLSIRIVELRAINSLAIKEADELILVTSPLLHLRLQSLDCDWFELAEGRLELAPIHAGRDNSWSKHLRLPLLLTLAFLLTEGVTRVSSLCCFYLFLVFATPGKHINFLLDTFDLVQGLIWFGKIRSIWINLRHEITLVSCILKLSIALFNIPSRVLALLDP